MTDLYRPRLNFFCGFTLAATFLLLYAGGLVTSTSSALAVPDWPLAYGMFFPPMVGGIFFEHGHRIVAGVVLILSSALTVWLWRSPAGRRHSGLRWFGLAAWFAVILQALLGGATVLFFLPKESRIISMIHAVLGQTFFCFMVALTHFTSPGFATHLEATGFRAPSAPRLPWAARPGLFLAALIYAQLILGAVVRHSDYFSALVAHAGNALLILIAVSKFAQGAWYRRHESGDRFIARQSAFLLALVLAQILLGVGAYVLRIGEDPDMPSGPAVMARTMHQSLGALVLGTSVWIALGAWFGPSRPAVDATAALEGTAA